MTAVSERITGASVCFVAPDGRILFLHRGDGKGWDIPGGHREADESAEQNALREAREETGGLPYGELVVLDHQDGDGVDWSVFRMPVRYAFTPKLSDEHDGFQWSAFEDRPGDMMAETDASLRRGYGRAQDDFNESDHPRAENGQFGSGSGGEKGNASTSESSVAPTDEVRATNIQQVNEPFDKEKVSKLAESMERDGWQGRPVLAYRSENGETFALTGSHRIEAAKEAGIDVPIYEIDGLADFEDDDGDTISDITRSGDARDIAEFVKKLGDKSATALAEEEADQDGTWGRASDCLAFDRASVRTVDKDGRLHVALTHISKANVCPYRGDEIVGAEKLGLDCDRIYMLLRDPEELQKGAPTSNGIQVMSEHVGVDAEDPHKTLIIGATGNDAAFNAPYLDNSLVIWDAEAIKGIDDGSQQQISCSYRYRADMTAGRYEGVSYDGIMRDIVFNHVAIVPVGRAGPDVLVGDSLSSLTGVTTMGKSLSKKAAMAKGALLAILKPKKLAADKALDLDKLLEGVTTENWLTKKAGIIAAIKPKLAQDADLGDVVELIDALDKEQPEGAAPAEITVDEDPRIEKILSLIRGKVSDEDLQAVSAALKESAAEDENEEERRKREEEERKSAEARGAATDEPQQTPGAAAAHPDGKPDDEKVSKSAMDAAIATERARSAKALREVEAKTIERLRSIASAEEEVRPYVGKLAVAMDSAEAVYKTALETMGVDVAGIHPSAYRAVLMAHSKPGATQKRVANDASMTPSITDAFPNAARLR